MKQTIKIEDFAYLLLATLSTKPKIIDLNDGKNIVVRECTYDEYLEEQEK